MDTAIILQILIIIGLVLLVFFAARSMIRRFRDELSGKRSCGGCSGSCGSCASCSACGKNGRKD